MVPSDPSSSSSKKRKRTVAAAEPTKKEKRVRTEDEKKEKKKRAHTKETPDAAAGEKRKKEEETTATSDREKEKKDKKSTSTKTAAATTTTTEDKPTAAATEDDKPKKKQRTRKPRDATAPASVAVSVATEEKEGKDAKPAASGDSKKSTRFIAFIGNLPYTTTKSSLESHFSAVSPASIRLMTAKDDPQKCKGFAFLEFARYDKMELCLTKFHHSVFNDGKSPARKINVELTAGGGGKSKARKQKLLVKNDKLNEERQRSAADRAKDKLERRATAEDVDNGIHPSRRGRL